MVVAYTINNNTASAGAGFLSHAKLTHVMVPVPIVEQDEQVLSVLADVEMTDIVMSNLSPKSPDRSDINEIDADLSRMTVVPSEEVQSIIDGYEAGIARMIPTPAPGRSILRRVSKYDQVSGDVSLPTGTVNKGLVEIPIVSVDAALAPASTLNPAMFPIKVKRMSSTGATLSSAAVMLENLKSALKIPNRKSLNGSVSSSASSSTTTLHEDVSHDSSESVHRVLRFNANVIVGETWHTEDYDRHPGEMIAKRLTPQVAAVIKRELNEFKAREMTVHEESRHHTVFYPL